MASARAFVPKFLQKFDSKLLLRNPSVWSARTHLVLYFFLLFGVVCSAIAFLYFKDARGNQNVEVFTAFTVIVALIAMVFWLIFLLRFNVFKRFGKLSFFEGVVIYLLYFINTGMIVLIPFLPAIVQSYCANRQFSSDEIVKDVNHLNVMLTKLEFENLPKYWDKNYYVVTSDSTLLNRGTEMATIAVDAVAEVDTVVASNANEAYEDSRPFYNRNFTYIDAGAIDEYRMNGDSIVQENDTSFILFQAPGLQFVEVNSYSSDQINLALFTNREIYNVARSTSKSNAAVMQDSIKYYKAKYADIDGHYLNNYGYYDQNNTGYFEKIKEKYKISPTGGVISDILDRKNFLLSEVEIFIRVWYYPTLFLSLLIFIFRHTTVKTFFFSILAAVILAILTGLVISVTSRMEEIMFLNILFAYSILFGVLSVVGLTAKRRLFVFGMSIGFFLISIPMLPLLGRLIYLYKRRFELNYEGFDEHNFTYEIAGFVLLLFVIQFLVGWLYRKWYALPQE